MPSFTISPSSFAVARPRVVVATGSGTSWLSGTLFSVSGGGSVSGISVNTGAQTATFTLNPGPDAGTLTVSNDADAATASITVATSITISGSNLDTWSAGGAEHYCFDATNEIPADAAGHVITISGGTFTAGDYTISEVIAALNMGGQGTHNVAVLHGIPSPYDAPSAGSGSGGTWSIEMKAGGNGLSGHNLIPWSADPSGSYYFDPDSSISSAINGAVVSISGAGFTAADYTVINFLAAFATVQHGNVNLIQVSQTGGQYPAAPGVFGGTWTKTGGDSIPTPDVNTDFTGDINLLLIGDSITARQTTTTATALETQYPNANSVNVVNWGAFGATTANWLPVAPSGYLADAIADAVSAGCTVASIMLGTNDAKVTPLSDTDHATNMQAIVDALFDGIPTLRAVVLQEAPYVTPGTPAWSSNSDTNDALVAYFATYSTITGATAGASTSNTNYAFFERNQQLLDDGVHPTTSGTAEVNYSWLLGLATPLTGPTGPSVAPSATLNPVTGTTTVLSANLTGGASPFTYSWTCTDKPLGSSPSFSNAAVANPTVTFDQAGDYTFSLTVTDNDAATDTGTVDVTVDQTLTTITVTPSSAVVALSGTQAFTAAGFDQFGDSQSISAPTWTVESGDGSINSSIGVYTADSSAGSAVVRATSDGEYGEAEVVVSDFRPTIGSVGGYSNFNVGGGITF